VQVLEIISTMGPGRRASVTVVEMVLRAEAGEEQQFDNIAATLQQDLPARLQALGLAVPANEWAELDQRTGSAARIGGYVCRTALALQQLAGHDLQFHDFLQDQAPADGSWRYRFIFQHDDIPSGEQAGDLALCIASSVCTKLRWQALLHDAGQSLEAGIADFVAGSRPFVTPKETLALIAAAQARRIPVLRLEREPYGKLPARFRVAPNGMVMLGHSRYRLMLDGLFCINRPGPGFSIMQDRQAMWNLLRQLGFPPPAAEPHNDGLELDLLVVCGKLLAALGAGKAVAVDAAMENLARHMGRVMNCGVLRIRCRQQEPAVLGGPGWSITGLDPSPPVETLLRDYPDLRQRTYDLLLDWLFPPGQPCRIPIISITGTNGKTTTSSMVARIAKAESKFVGMARTTGVYFGDELRELGDSSGFLGHCMVFEHPEVDLAVLETARGDVLRAGFAFDSSDVAICTNVTADHLGEHGVETVADMAVVKRSVLERCVGTVVLNGDDELCREMLPHLSGRRIILSSFNSNPNDLLRKLPAETAGLIDFVHVAPHQGEDWIMLREGDNLTPVIAVNAIPATFKGAARHNISNAMHAIAGARALGLSLASIRQALGGFEMGYDSLPGRLNLHFNGRFHTIMDYAHNADGLKQLVRFTNQYPCKGRRILRFGVSPKASRAACRGAAATVAGHFDYYICSAKPGHDPGDGIDTAAELRLGLLERGVDEAAIEIFTDVERSVEHPASLCREGDLLVLVTSNAGLAFTWEKVLKT
jgi:UDP-N-acetylmuramyl tripeptide synthase